AVVPELQARGAEPEEHAEELLDVLRSLGLAQASFVGRGRGAPPVARLAADHPDRVDAVVLVGQPEDDLTGEAAVAAGGAFTAVGEPGEPVEDEEEAAPHPTPILILPAHQLAEEGPEAFADLVVDFLRHR